MNADNAVTGARVPPRAAQQINGREDETAAFLSNLSVELGVARWRFLPTSSQSLRVF